MSIAVIFFLHKGIQFHTFTRTSMSDTILSDCPSVAYLSHMPCFQMEISKWNIFGKVQLLLLYPEHPPLTLLANKTKWEVLVLGQLCVCLFLYIYYINVFIFIYILAYMNYMLIIHMLYEFIYMYIRISKHKKEASIYIYI